jgi:hypothetical protein
MNPILSSGLVALLLACAAFGQADKGKPPDPQSKDDTDFQKGHKDPSALPKQKKDQKKKGKDKQPDKTGKSTKADPIDPHEPPVPYGPNAPTIKR